MNLKENKKLAGIVGVIVAGAVGLGAWLFLAWSGYAESMENWDTTQSKIAAIKGKKLEPTEANVAAREKLLTDYADKVNNLRTALLAVQQPVKPMSETEFQAKLKDRATEIKRQAKTMAMTPLPDDFALGFDKYASQPPRSAEIAAELNVHLDVVEKVLTTCIESGVTTIDSIERTKLANEDAPTPAKAEPVKAKTSSKASTGKTAKGKKPVITEQAAAEPVLDRYPIKLLITTDQGPLQSILNTFCHPGKMPYFLVVRQLRIENQRLDGPTKEEMNAKRSSTASAAAGLEPLKPAAPAAPDAPQLISAPRPSAPDAYDIMGNELLKVYLELDYVRFRPAAEIEEEAAPDASKS